eukprot:UN22489
MTLCLPFETIWRRFLANDCKYCLTDYLVNDYEDVMVEPWHSQENVFQRRFSLTTQLTGALSWAGTQASVKSTVSLYRNGDTFVMDKKTVTSGVPCSSLFIL